jgi:hypothetical protein
VVVKSFHRIESSHNHPPSYSQSAGVLKRTPSTIAIRGERQSIGGVFGGQRASETASIITHSPFFCR